LTRCAPLDPRATARAVLASSSFWLRSQRYRRISLEPRIASRTAFYSAASTVTRAFAFSIVSPFMASLSRSLEDCNVARAIRIRSGDLYASGTLEANTLDFVRFEQCLVECALERLRAVDPLAFAREIALADAALHRAAREGVLLVSAAHHCLRRALLELRQGLGRWPSFAQQHDRELLGVALALRSTPSR
jgi:hypothetical protein